MGYYIRVLGLRDEQPSIADLSIALSAADVDARISADPGTEADWSTIILEHPDEHAIAMIVRIPVMAGELGAAEIGEFAEQVGRGSPRSAIDWLRQFFPQVTVIYSFQVLSGADVDEGWKALHTVRDAIWMRTGGIGQADQEGFSNESGFHILWQFSDGVEGPHNMAVLCPNGEWVAFKMDLEDRVQRAAFQRGEIPLGAKLLEQ